MEVSGNFVQLQQAEAQGDDHEANIEELQAMITELHQEMFQKDQDNLAQLQRVHQLESRVKELTEQFQDSAETLAHLRHESVERAANSSSQHKVSSELTAARGIELLKSELSRRDASIRKLQRDLLLSHQARDSQSAQLDVQEQKLWELQRELQGCRQELQRRHRRIQQLSRELQDTSQQAPDLQAQEERLGAELCCMQTAATQQGSEEEVQKTQRRCRGLETALPVTQGQLSVHHDGNGHNRADEELQQLQEEVTRLKAELSCVSQQLQERTTELCSLKTAQRELRVREKEWQRENSSLRQQLHQTREELHSATLRAEEQRLKEVQIDELQREVDRTLALLEKDREDGSQMEELEKLREEKEQLKDKVSQGEARALKLERELEQSRQERRREVKHWAEQRELLRYAQLQDAQQSLHNQQGENRCLQDKLAECEKRLAALSLEAESLREKVRASEQESTDLRRELLTSQDSMRQVSAELASCRRDLREQESQRAGQEQRGAELQAELAQLQHQYTTCYTQLVKEETSVSRLRTDLQEVEAQGVRLASESQQQQTQIHVLMEKHVTAQQEISSREEKLLSLAAELQNTEERLRGAQEELSEQVQEVKCKNREFVAVQKEMKGVQELLSQREEELQVEIHKTVQLRLEKDSLLTQCESQRVALRGLRREVQQWQQEARDQREGQEKEVQQLREELQETKGRLLQEKTRLECLGRELETAHQQQRDAEEEASQREAVLRTQGVELARVKTSLLEAHVQVSGAETRLQLLSESVELYKHKYQACVTKLAQVEGTLHSQEGLLKEARAQASERAEQVLRLQAEVVSLRADVQGRQAQLESGDEALAALTQHLEDTQSELHECRAHARDCELVIGTLRDNTAVLRRQVEEQEEAVVKIQSDSSMYSATHIHSNSEYESQLSHIQELEQALSQAQERCGQGARELSACQAELEQLKEEACRQRQLKDSSLSEVHKLQELVTQLQAEAVCEAQSKLMEMNTLEEQLEAARRQCAQKEKSVQKRDVLLRQSEADLVCARDELQSRATETDRQAGVVRALEAELRRFRKEKRRREGEHAALSAHLLQVQQELKESQATCRESAQELAQQLEKVLLLEKEQQCAREQLVERTAEAVRSEQGQRTLHTELQNLQHRLHSTEQELHDYRVLLEQASSEASRLRQAQQENRVVQEELADSKQALTQLQEQLKDQTEAARTLRAELAQEKLDWEQSTRNTVASLETERDQLRTDLDIAKDQLSERERLVAGLQERVSELQSATLRLQEDAAGGVAQLQYCRKEVENRATRIQSLQLEVQTLEGRLVELQSQLAHTQLWGQQQSVSLQSREEEVLQLKAELLSVRDGCYSAVAQIEVLQAQVASAEQREALGAAEVEELREALVEARSDTSRLHHESELVVTNVNHWVKEQKQTHEKLGLKIKDQSKRIVHLTAENDHLQERVETLQTHIRRLQAEVDERRLEAERWKNFGAQSPGEEQIASAQAHGHRPTAQPSLSSRTTYSHQRENPRRVSPLVAPLGPS